MSWVYLIVAGLFELGWPLGFKLAAKASGSMFVLCIVGAMVAMGLSSFFLYLAQRTIPIGTAYIVWTGIGGVGTALMGMIFFHDAVTVARLVCLTMVLGGIIGLYVFK